MKFKVGDKVRVTSNTRVANHDVGMEFTITDIDHPPIDSIPIRIKIDDYNWWWVSPEDIELVEEEKSPTCPAKYQIVYKLVENRDGVLESWFPPQSIQRLTYSIFAKIKQLDKEHPLFTFDSVESARKTASKQGWRYANAVILKCIAKIGGSKPPDYPDYYLEIPEGTVFCRWVIPFEVVEE